MDWNNKRILIAVSILSGFLAISGCRTTEEEASDVANFKPNPIDPVPPAQNKTVFASFSGDDAKEVFDAMTTLGKRVDTFKTAKIEQGMIRLYCEHNGFPPGAQGMPGPMIWKCTARQVIANGIPPGAQGIAPPFLQPFFDADGTQAAAALGKNLDNVTFAWDANLGQYVVNLTITDADFVCTKNAASGNAAVQPNYNCDITGTKEASPLPTEITYADFTGADAKLVFSAMKTIGKRVDTFSTAKIEQGNILITCDHTGIPPGAQGMAGPTKYNCQARRMNGGIPNGAQGMPSPALPPFLAAKNTKAAFALSNNLKNIDFKWDGNISRYVAALSLKPGEFVCTSKKSGPNASALYSCKITTSAAN